MPFIEASRRGYSPRRRTAGVDEGVERSPQLWKFCYIRNSESPNDAPSRLGHTAARLAGRASSLTAFTPCPDERARADAFVVNCAIDGQQQPGKNRTAER